MYLGDSTRIKIIPDESLGVDVTIILGKDYTSFAELNNYISAKINLSNKSTTQKQSSELVQNIVDCALEKKQKSYLY